MREDTRARVIAAAAEVGYAPSPSAASLASGRTRTIGIITPWVQRWFHGGVIEGAERALREKGFDALLYSFDLDERSQVRVDVDPGVLRRRVDGVLVVGMVLHAQEIDAIVGLGVPLVYVGAGPDGLACIHLDDVEAGRAAAGHLADRGHQVVAHISGPAQEWVEWSPPLARARGFEEVAEAAGWDPDPALRVHGDFTSQGGHEAMEKVWRARPDLTAVVADSDAMAMGAWRYLRSHGVDIPGRVSLVGIDGMDVGEFVGLTSFAQDPVALGWQAARMVLDLIVDPQQVPRLVIAPELIERSSVAPLR